MPVLQDIDQAYGYLPRAVLEHLACRWQCGWPRSCGWPASTIVSAWSRSAGTWSRSARARRATRRGSRALLERLEKELGVGPARPTSPGDSRCGRSAASGCCALSPAMKIDGRSFGRVDIDRVAGDLGAIRMSRPIRNVADLDQAAAAGPGDALSAAAEDPGRLGQLRRGRGGPGRRGRRPPRPSRNLGWTPSSAAPAASASARRSRCWTSCSPTARG